MLSRVSLVAILLTLSCVIRAMECSRSPRVERQGTGRDVAAAGEGVLLWYAHGNVTTEDPSSLTSTNDYVVKDKPNDKVHTRDAYSAHTTTGVEERDRPRARKRRMDRTMLALLMAYKLKFIALIPTMLGGLILLKSTTLLAGFFFALFATVLGLKHH